MSFLTHLWPSPWNNAYNALEARGQAGNPDLDAKLFPGAPFSTATLDAAYQSPLKYDGVDLDVDSANYWAERWWATQVESDLSPHALLETAADAIEPASQWVSDTSGWSSPENREPDAPLSGLSPWAFAAVVVVGLFAVWSVTK